MKHTAVALVIVACIAGAAIAQDAQTPRRPTITWDEQASGRDYVRYYPGSAMHQDIPGAASLCCTVNAERRLDCTVNGEWPEGLGFGEASLSIARRFQVSETSYTAMQVAGDLSVKRTIVWNMAGGDTSVLDRAVEIMNQAACPAPEDSSQVDQEDSESTASSALDPQEATPGADTRLYVADLERRPGAAPLTGPTYPERAVRRRTSGIVHLCCAARDDRSLACEIASEWPNDEGFGDRAIELASLMQLTESSHQLYLSRPDARVHLPVRFNALPLRDDFVEESQRVEAEAIAACGVTNAQSAPFVISTQRAGRQRR